MCVLCFLHGSSTCVNIKCKLLSSVVSFCEKKGFECFLGAGWFYVQGVETLSRETSTPPEDDTHKRHLLCFMQFYTVIKLLLAG